MRGGYTFPHSNGSVLCQAADVSPYGSLRQIELQWQSHIEVFLAISEVPGSGSSSLFSATSLLRADISSQTLALTALLTASSTNLRCLCRGSRNDAINATLRGLSTSSGDRRRFSARDTAFLNCDTFADSAGDAHRCLDSRVAVTGYIIELDTPDSPHRAVVAHFSERRTGSNSSITFQPSSVRSRVRASDSLVKALSERTATIAHRCSFGRSNISWVEFHLVRQGWTRRCSGRFWSFCFWLSACVAVVLWWKCETSRPAEMTTLFIAVSLKPSLIASWRVWAKQGFESPSIHRIPFLLRNLWVACLVLSSLW